MSKHLTALRTHIDVQYGRTLKRSDIKDVEAAADHMAALEAQLRIAKRALRRLDRFPDELNPASNSAHEALAAMRQAAIGGK